MTENELEKMSNKQLLIQAVKDISALQECAKAIPRIENHLRQLNNNVANVTQAGAVTRTIADSAKEKADKAKEKADKNTRNFYVGLSILAIAVIGALATILAQVI